MIVNDIPFFGHFLTKYHNDYLQICNNSYRGQLAKYLIKIIKLYARGGFITHLVLMDM